MSPPTCPMHAGHELTLCLECFRMERVYARHDVEGLVADVTFLDALLLRLAGHVVLSTDDMLRVALIRRSLIDRAAALRVIDAKERP